MMNRATNSFDWRSRLVQAVDEKHKKRARRTPNAHKLTLEPTDAVWPLVVRAATRRGASPTTYARRALLAFVAHDLNMRLEDVLKLDPRWTAPGKRQAIHDPEGNHGGSWEIEDLR